MGSEPRIRDMPETVKPPSAHDQTTDQAKTKQSRMGICNIPMNPIKACS